MWSLLIACSFVAVAVVIASYDERRLYEDLMRDYNSLERPVANHSKPVTVYLKVSLQQIIDVDEKNQIVYVNAWLDYTWKDYKLVWDVSEYGNITDVRFPAGRIWKPDVLLYNSVDTNFDSTYPTNMVVYSTGDVHWVPPGIFKISCKIDIEWFPFDEQRCKFKFGSWTYDGFKLDLQPAKKGFDISEYLPNGEWTLPLTTVSRNVKFYDCCPEPYPDLTFYLHMRRRTLYYGFNLIMPCILTTLMTLLGFTLPPDAGEKITLQITVLLSICFFLSIVSEMSPPTSEAVPLLGIFFTCCMIVVTASTVFTVYVLNLHYRTPETHEMTPVVRRIDFVFFVQLIFERLMNGISPSTALPQTQISAPLDLGQQATLLILQRIYQELKVVTKRMMETDREGQASNNWKFAAMVVDRLCLYVFTMFILASTIGIFSSAPYLVA
nr:Neurotransmitter-gated ion-channel ligand-binding and Neurotransmitter-gated ion-channel transmembrane region domain containing protein [Haemonchus contortus]